MINQKNKINQLQQQHEKLLNLVEEIKSVSETETKQKPEIHETKKESVEKKVEKKKKVRKETEPTVEKSVESVPDGKEIVESVKETSVDEKIVDKTKKWKEILCKNEFSEQEAFLEEVKRYKNNVQLVVKIESLKNSGQYNESAYYELVLKHKRGEYDFEKTQEKPEKEKQSETEIKKTNLEKYWNEIKDRKKMIDAEKMEEIVEQLSKWIVEEELTEINPLDAEEELNFTPEEANQLMKILISKKIIGDKADEEGCYPVLKPGELAVPEQELKIVEKSSPKEQEDEEINIFQEVADVIKNKITEDSSIKKINSILIRDKVIDKKGKVLREQREKEQVIVPEQEPDPKKTLELLSNEEQEKMNQMYQEFVDQGKTEADIEKLIEKEEKKKESDFEKLMLLNLCLEKIKAEKKVGEVFEGLEEYKKTDEEKMIKRIEEKSPGLFKKTYESFRKINAYDLFLKNLGVENKAIKFATKAINLNTVLTLAVVGIGVGVFAPGALATGGLLITKRLLAGLGSAGFTHDQLSNARETWSKTLGEIYLNNEELVQEKDNLKKELGDIEEQTQDKKIGRKKRFTKFVLKRKIKKLEKRSASGKEKYLDDLENSTQEEIKESLNYLYDRRDKLAIFLASDGKKLEENKSYLRINQKIEQLLKIETEQRVESVKDFLNDLSQQEDQKWEKAVKKEKIARFWMKTGAVAVGAAVSGLLMYRDAQAGRFKIETKSDELNVVTSAAPKPEIKIPPIIEPEVEPEVETEKLVFEPVYDFEEQLKDATVTKENNGIISVLQKQLSEHPEKFGYDKSSGLSSEDWAKAKANNIAFNKSYGETWVKEPGKVAYILEGNEQNGFDVKEVSPETGKIIGTSETFDTGHEMKPIEKEIPVEPETTKSKIDYGADESTKSELEKKAEKYAFSDEGTKIKPEILEVPIEQEVENVPENVTISEVKEPELEKVPDATKFHSVPTEENIQTENLEEIEVKKIDYGKINKLFQEDKIKSPDDLINAVKEIKGVEKLSEVEEAKWRQSFKGIQDIAKSSTELDENFTPTPEIEKTPEIQTPETPAEKINVILDFETPDENNLSEVKNIFKDFADNKLQMGDNKKISALFANYITQNPEFFEQSFGEHSAVTEQEINKVWFDFCEHLNSKQVPDQFDIWQPRETADGKDLFNVRKIGDQGVVKYEIDSNGNGQADYILTEDELKDRMNVAPEKPEVPIEPETEEMPDDVKIESIDKNKYKLEELPEKPEPKVEEAINKNTEGGGRNRSNPK